MSWNWGTMNPPAPIPNARGRAAGPPMRPNLLWRLVSAGLGVDHVGMDFGFGFGYGPDGFNAWTGPSGYGGRGSGPRGGRGGGRRHRHGRHGHGHHSDEEASGADEDLYDITTAATVAEAEMQGEVAGRDSERDGSPVTIRDVTGEPIPDPPEDVPAPQPRGCRGRRGGWGGRGRHYYRGYARGHQHPHPHPAPPPFPLGPPFTGVFDTNTLLSALGNHPYAQHLRSYLELARGDPTQPNGDEGAETDGNFTPPVDLFNTRNDWTLHVAVPGAKKEDITVSWDVDRATLSISGIVHRPGDEEFINSLLSSERTVGQFERKIRLPPTESNGTKDEVDGDHITARMEDGILIVTVPKVEKEWTEIRNVDIL